MTTAVQRRAFVATLAAGLPMMTMSSAVTAQRRGSTGTAGAQMEAELLRQLREGVRGMQGERRGEATRRLAATLRLASAHLRETGADSQFQATLREMVARNGEPATIARDITPFVAQDLRELGIRALPPQGDYASRQAALRELQARGITPTLVAVAGVLEQVSVDLDRLPIVTIARRASSCPDMRAQLLFVEVAMIVACLVNPITCAIFAGMYTGLMIGLATLGC